MAAYDITHRRGDTYQGAAFSFSLNGSPLDLTGAAVLMQIKKNSADSTAVLEFTEADGTIDDNTFALSPVIIGVAPRAYVYDLQITLASGRVITPVSGTFEILSDVSRA